MREIKFRGKRVDNGEWVHGGLVGVDCSWAIAIEMFEWVDNSGLQGGDWWHVAPESVGQFTGLCDCNGREIYEGDIVRHRAFGIKEVVWGNKFEKCLSYACGFMYDKTIAFVHSNESDDVEVIGNIHDNPELLEQGKEVEHGQ